MKEYHMVIVFEAGTERMIRLPITKDEKQHFHLAIQEGVNTIVFEENEKRHEMVINIENYDYIFFEEVAE